MNKVAIVVQRCHPSIVGGSESLAWQYANLLKEAFAVEVLTTTALDNGLWSNTVPAGAHNSDGVLLRRFPVTLGRLPFWGRLHERLAVEVMPTNGADGGAPQPGRRWSLALQEEFVRTQGPYSEPLLQFIRDHWREYQTIIFVTYLYATSYFGMLQVPANFSLFAPTLHDEEPAYLTIYKHAARRCRELIWLTQAERSLGHKLWGELPGRVIGMEIDTALRSPAESPAPYVLYCGRIDPNKGCRELFEYFIQYKQDHPCDLKLVLAGIDDIPIPEHRDIDYRGFVSQDEKFSLMAGATVLAMPSARESFSIVTLEAMAQRTPIICSEFSAVVSDHVRRSQGGELYRDYASFARKLNELISDKEKRARMGLRGREYVLSNYQPERVRGDLIATVEACKVKSST